MENKNNIFSDKQDDNIKKMLDELPDIEKYQDLPIKNKSNWFAKNLILFISIIGVFLIIIIVLLIKLLT